MNKAILISATLAFAAPGIGHSADVPRDSGPNGVTTHSDSPGDVEEAFPTGPEKLDTTRISAAPSPGAAASTASAPPQRKLPPGLDARNRILSVNMESLPLPKFIDEVLGEVLKVNYQVAPEVSSQDALVTLRTPEPVSAVTLYEIAEQVLGEYGVAIEYDGKLVQVQTIQTAASQRPPILISGRASPDVPVTHRPVFQLVDLRIVRAADAASWLETLFGDRVTVAEDTRNNSLLVSGNPSDVAAATRSLVAFDAPSMRGRTSQRIDPAFLAPDVLADRLIELLGAQGFAAAKGLGIPASVVLVPVREANALFVFANGDEAMRLTLDWAKEIDRPTAGGGEKGFFYYQVKNTSARDLLSVLGNQGQGVEGEAAVAQPAANQTARPTEGGTSVVAGRGRVILDSPRNGLIFEGSASEWERMLPLIRQLDREPRQVMVEVTIAEVTVDGEQDFGLGWFAKNGFGRFNGRLNVGSLAPSSGSSASTGSGLNYILDVAGQNRAALRAFASDSRVNILSTPTLLVRSGEEANIDVGTEVPTISSQTASSQQTDGTSNLLQTVQYRRTGILLNITPTIYSDDRVDLAIQQEVSEALPLADDSTAGSPSIFNRSIKTSLSLRDGGSVVLGGLRSTRNSTSSSGVPILKNIPGIGAAFRSSGTSQNRTELVVMIVPYIIGSNDDARDISDRVLRSMPALDVSHERGEENSR